jgi:uncharacterized membrane protein
MSVPVSALTLAYWLHMLATVLWIGGISSLALLVLPAANKALDAAAYAALLEKIQKRLDPLGWICLAVLAATGLVQMSANPNYQGFIAIHNRWAAAILVKHLLFLFMTGISVYLKLGLLREQAACSSATGCQPALSETSGCWAGRKSCCSDLI